ncbi:MAG: Rha family transcriptional regulator [Alphaproteobacteria bacterium]
MNNLVNISNNKAVTTSKIIADTFGKAHKDVIRAINNLEIPEDFRERNFAPSNYKSRNQNGQLLPAYEITRDGFTLLAMGFTGKTAMEFKIKYINAFNKMEEKLKAIYPCGEKSVVVSEHLRSLPVKKELTLSPKIRAELTELVNTQVEQTLRKVLADVFYPGINQHPSDMPFGNWAVSAVHAIGAMRSEYENLKDRQQEVIRLLEDKR